jgi:hypothetical protein
MTGFQDRTWRDEMPPRVLAVGTVRTIVHELQGGFCTVCGTPSCQRARRQAAAPVARREAMSS